MSQPPMTLQEELLNDLSESIRAGDLVVDTDVSLMFSKLKEHYPTGMSGIAWELIREGCCSPSPDPKPPMDEDLPRIVDFLDLFATQAQISNEDPVIVIGDCAMDVTLRMSFQTFRNHLKLMIELPQYTYVLAKDFQWCFCYTFEDDMYFGKAQQKKKKMEKGLGTKGTGTDVNRG